MELDKLIDLPQTEISFPYGVISSEEAHNLFLNRTELGGYRYSPYRFRDLDYQFQSWLEGREGGELYDNDQRNNYTNLMYSHTIVVDLLGGHDSWHDAFNADPDYLLRLYNMWIRLQEVIIPTYLRDSLGYDLRDLQTICRRLYNDNSDTLDYSVILPGDQLPAANYRDGYYSRDNHMLLNILKSTWDIPHYAWPSGISYFTGGEEDPYWKVGLFERNMFQATDAIDFWKAFPARYIYVPIPSKSMVDWMDENSGRYGSYNSSHVGWSGSLTSQAVMRCKQTYGYRDYTTSEEGHMVVYDSHEKRFIDHPMNWSRQHKECVFCRRMYNTHRLTWYKSVGGYSNGNRSRACFQCVLIHSTSYNAAKKCFVKVDTLPTNDNRYGYIDMENDQYVQYMHGDDLPTARGARQFMWEMIEDEDWQSVDDLDYIPHEARSLPIDVRKFMTWVKQSFGNNPGDDKTEHYKDMKYQYILGSDSEAGRQNVDDVDTAIYIVPDDDMVDENNEVLLKSAFIKWKGLQLPVISMYGVNDDLVSSVMSLRIDNRNEDRTWYVYQPGRRARVRTSDEMQTADDGWLSPNNMDPAQMVLGKQEYRYSPPYTYVHYRNGQFRHFPLHGMEPCSPQEDCTCGLHETSVSHADSYHWHYNNGLFMGMELELVIRDERLFRESGYNEVIARTIQTFHTDDMMKQILYAKRDGSLPSGTGVEYISFPMTLDAWKQVPEMFWNLVESNYKAFGLDDVGIHIHFPWASMDLGHAYAMLTALNTLQINPHGLLLYIAQRSTGQWARWDLLQYRDTYNTIAEVAKNRTRDDNDKYKGINMQHEHTIELRYFKSNAKANRVIKNLEFVDALYEMTKADTDGLEWDTDRDIPSNALIDMVASYQNTSSKYKVDIVHDEEVPYAHYIEHKLVQYVLANGDRYPYLHDYLLGLTANENPREFTLADVGIYDNTQEEEEYEMAIEEETVEYLPMEHSFNGSQMITVQGTTYNVNSLMFADDGEVS